MKPLPAELRAFEEPLRELLRGRDSITLDTIKRHLPASKALLLRTGGIDGRKVARILRHLGWKFADRQYRFGETIVTYRRAELEG